MSWGFISVQGEYKLTRKDTVLAAVWKMGWEGWAGEKSGTGIQCSVTVHESGVRPHTGGWVVVREKKRVQGL